MGTLFISEYSEVGYCVDGGMQAAEEPEITNQTVTTSGTSAQSATLNKSTRLVRLHTDTAINVLFGSNPTALATSKKLPADATEYFAVEKGSDLKIAAIDV